MRLGCRTREVIWGIVAVAAMPCRYPLANHNHSIHKPCQAHRRGEKGGRVMRLKLLIE